MSYIINGHARARDWNNSNQYYVYDLYIHEFKKNEIHKKLFIIIIKVLKHMKSWKRLDVDLIWFR